MENNVKHEKNYRFHYQMGYFSLSTLKTGEPHVSRDFPCGNAVWNLIIYPNGFNKYSSKYVSVFLHLKNSDRIRRSVSFGFSVSGHLRNTQKEAEEEFLKGKKAGFTEFVLKERIPWLLSSTCVLEIACSITDFSDVLIDSSVVYTDGDYFLLWQQASLIVESLDMREFFGKELYSDIIIKVDDLYLPAHKAILQSRTNILSDGCNIESRHNNIIEVNTFHEKYFVDFLYYIYSGDRNVIRSESVVDLYDMAIKYGADTLKTSCLEFCLQYVLA